VKDLNVNGVIEIGCKDRSTVPSYEKGFTFDFKGIDKV
jgi:hypothetical protein